MESLIIFLPISIFIIFRVIRSDQSKRAKRIGILTILILLLLAVTCNEYGFVPSDKKYVHVNGYYRKDGTYVRSYYRSYPGEKNKSPGKDYRWIFVGVMCIVSITGLIKINEQLNIFSHLKCLLFGFFIKSINELIKRLPNRKSRQYGAIRLL